MNNNTNKRGRLIEGAKVLFYHRGVAQSTLADIAQQALVPLGNVYYYFPSKEPLVEAVIQAHIQELQSWFAQLERNPDPRQRLLGLLNGAHENEQALARYGCPHGSLCQELDKEGSQPATTAAQLFQVYLNWAEAQFRLLGKNEEEAQDFALDLISSLQGTFLLTNSFRSPELLERKLQRLETWLRTL
jgi:TetR/AcrR family transcriptional regulator, transcriptional repressor for nem operon